MMLARFETKKSTIMSDSLFKPESFIAEIEYLRNKEASMTLRKQLTPVTDHKSVFDEAGPLVGVDGVDIIMINYKSHS